VALVSDRWRPLLTLLRPSAPLLLVLLLYLRFDGTPHFFLHTLTGWDVALTLLLLGTYRGYSWSRWDGLLPLALALWALTYLPGWSCPPRLDGRVPLPHRPR
jgi:hypothetical protein